MQFTAHLDELDNLNKIKQSKNSSKRDDLKEKSGEQPFKLDIQPGAIGSHKKTEEKKNQVNDVITESNPDQDDSVFSKENIRFVLSRVLASVLIFVFGYVAINWSALSEVLKYRFDNNEIQEDLTGNNNHAAEDGNLLANNNQKVPDLNLAITPPDMRIVIPKIERNVPVVPVPTANLIGRDWQALENDIQEALQDGVVHYPGTAYPDQIGNVVITGHSSYFPWDPGRFKDVFALLHDLKLKDEVVVYFDQKKFVYQVDEIKTVSPDQVDVLGPTSDSRLTLITCTPIGTNKNRLIVRAKLVEGTLADGTKVQKIENN